MKVRETPLLALNPESEYDRKLNQELTKYFREIGYKVNSMARGDTSAFDNQSTAVPSSGTWAQGDYVKKSNPVIAGGAGSRYVIKGWIRITDGSSNVLNTDWAEDRALTGT